jgi:acyl-CoA synthetase (AMP-forming)/AMP-acid ligase II
MAVRTLDDHLRASAARTPDKTAIVAGERRVSYGELDRLADGIAGGLIASGVERGDRVGVFLPNTVEGAASIYGVLRAGAAFSPLNPTMKAEKLGQVLADAGATAIICESSHRSVVAEASTHAPALRTVICVGDGRPGDVAFADLAAHDAPRGLRASAIDLAALIYTSGSTGKPKGVTLTHQNMTFAAASLAEYLEMQQDEVVLLCLPLSFDYGLYQLLLTILVGGTLVLEKGFAFPGKVVQLLESEGVTGLPGVPTLFGVLLGLRGLEARELPALRYLSNTGAALSVTTIGGLRETFPKARIYSMYGLTECKRVSYLPPHLIDVKPASVGIAIPGTEVWVEDSEGNECAPGEVGELIVRGPHVMQGELMTGDLFKRDAEGHLYFVGRKDDMIKSRGEKVAPREVEEVLYAVPGVRDAAVIGVPDALLGSAIHAYVSVFEDAELDERALKRACAAKLEDYMVPQRIEIRDELPRSTAGKIDKLMLSSEALERLAAATA